MKKENEVLAKNEDKEILWVDENHRSERRIALIAAICYCAFVVIDIVRVRIPIVVFELNMIVVGIGYLVASYKSKYKYQFIATGILLIFVGMIIGVNFENKVLGIPLAIVGSSAGYTLLMLLLGINGIQTQKDFIDRPSFFFFLAFAFSMVIVHIVGFLGIITKMGFYDFGYNFLRIGSILIRLSQFSLMELASMLVVLLSMAMQPPKVVLVFDDDGDDVVVEEIYERYN